MRICFPNQRGKNLIFQQQEGNELCWVVVVVGWHREGVTLPGLHHSTVGRVSFSPGSSCAPQYLETASVVLVLKPCLGFWDEPHQNSSLNSLLLSNHGSHKAAVPMPAPQSPALSLTSLIQCVFEEEKPYFPSVPISDLPIRGLAAAAPGRAPLRPVWLTANCFLMADSV